MTAAPSSVEDGVVTYRPRLQPWLGWIEFPVLLVFGLLVVAALTGPSGFVIFAPLAFPLALLGPVTARSQVRIDADGVSVKVNMRSREFTWADVRRIDGQVVTLAGGELAVIPRYPRRVPAAPGPPESAAQAVAAAWKAARRGD